MAAFLALMSYLRAPYLGATGFFVIVMCSHIYHLFSLLLELACFIARSSSPYTWSDDHLAFFFFFSLAIILLAANRDQGPLPFFYLCELDWARRLVAFPIYPSNSCIFFLSLSLFLMGYIPWS
ncbi:hypothetical protein BO71DRAFT_80383 [Aspergillus ellipticus CBS 707.79]|uniref:Uncharacterized protein n=1 Tax=Aspergillus ellipticus CBS 707.79 TaxID=1448320 RepID=A0A319CYC1_9EURO|nr:hypothetical protein BO71DRAFT_80383 [Aspergillus ellipticus CBS 707.79]